MKKLQKVFLIETLFYLATLFLGIYVTLQIDQLIPQARAWSGSQEAPTVTGFVFYFLVATLIIYLISKSKRLEKGRKVFFKAAFFLSVIFGGLITLSAFTFDLLAAIIIIILVLAWQKEAIILLHNSLIVISVAGIGAVMGREFTPLTVASLLALFSVYDFIAVYKTKHMVKMAGEMIKTRAIMGLIIPFSFSDLLDSLEDKSKGEFMVLGGGDLAFPLFLTSAVTIHYGAGYALIISGFILLGLLGSFLLFTGQKEKEPIPALPPIALGSLVGYLFILILI